MHHPSHYTSSVPQHTCHPSAHPSSVYQTIPLSGANPRPTDRVDGRGGEAPRGEGAAATSHSVCSREGAATEAAGHGDA